MQKYLHIAIIVALIGGTFAGLWYVYSYSQSAQPTRTFSVSGQGKVAAIPDIAQVSFGVITEGGTDIASLQAQNTSKANRIIEFVKTQGVDPKDIKTQTYAIDPRYGKEAVTIIGYTIRNTLGVKIRDFSKISSVLSGVVERGANTVSQLSFTIDDPTSLQNQAREQAIIKAKDQAQAFAKAGKFRIGRLVSLSEGFVYPYPLAVGFGGEAVQSAETPVIEPGSQEVTVNVTLIYEIR